MSQAEPVINRLLGLHTAHLAALWCLFLVAELILAAQNPDVPAL